MPSNFLASPCLHTEPGKSRLHLLLTALSVSSLCLVSTWAHTERPVAVTMEKDQARVLQASAVSFRAVQAAGSELVSKLGRMMGRRSR